ncbi:hypothetical protein JRO89_XS13G0180200 [Xanthoceras sorbifolium]|uniref:Uncharacterized protein n=1 Tax=Xanthoceras sorbifolium TaxID=99658 RepID=A0ABQ8H8X3_9ROSI|nr:hypothetical protein JRO89_XS13G0180200 [Xanthoceras sorbifolium]
MHYLDVLDERSSCEGGQVPKGRWRLEDVKGLVTVKRKRRKCNWVGSDVENFIWSKGNHVIQIVPAEVLKANPIGDGKGKAKTFGNGPQCYKCKEFSHFAVVHPTCDQRIAYVCEKELVFKEEDEFNIEADKQEETKMEEERLQATNLLIYVIQHALTGHKQQENHAKHD